jgi:hypothetical protein
VRGDFSQKEILHSVGAVDIAYFFDVLLHQANPSWNQVLSLYSSSVKCIVIYNQQYIRSQTSLRLTQLPLEEYITLTPRSRENTYRYAYAHAKELHPIYQKPWLDIHNIFQWGITDNDLRSVMTTLGFREVHFKNCGQFSNLRAFENHEFIFVRDQMSIPWIVVSLPGGLVQATSLEFARESKTITSVFHDHAGDYRSRWNTWRYPCGAGCQHAAVWTNNEADIVDSLRTSFREAVSLVAIQRNNVVGHILFTPVIIMVYRFRAVWG